MNRQEAMEILRLYRYWNDQKPLNDDEEALFTARKNAIRKAYAVLIEDEPQAMPSAAPPEPPEATETTETARSDDAAMKAYDDGFKAGAEQMRERAAATAGRASDAESAIRSIRALPLREGEDGTEPA